MEMYREEPEPSMAANVLPEPHFDEATLLSARPVVPLEVVKAEARSGRRLRLGLVVAIALLIGAFGATLISKLRRPQEPTEITEVDDTSLPLQPSITAGAAAVGPPVATAPRDPLTVRERVVQPAAKEERHVSPEQPIERSEPRSTERAKNRDDDKDLRRAANWEARRLRRVEKEARRKDGGRHERSNGDLLRIREIFEGPPTP